MQGCQRQDEVKRGGGVVGHRQRSNYLSNTKHSQVMRMNGRLPEPLGQPGKHGQRQGGRASTVPLGSSASFQGLVSRSGVGSGWR